MTSEENSRFEGFMNKISKEINELMKEKKFEGSWEQMPSKLMLVVTEISEAMEEFRDDNKKKFATEIADAIIRLLHICGFMGIDIEKEIKEKMLTNEKRPVKHGRKMGV